MEIFVDLSTKDFVCEFGREGLGKNEWSERNRGKWDERTLEG